VSPPSHGDGNRDSAGEGGINLPEGDGGVPDQELAVGVVGCHPIPMVQNPKILLMHTDTKTFHEHMQVK
jgi:hypothetical protein